MSIIKGNYKSNILHGSFSNDTIYGNNGDDWLYGFGGNDLLLGNNDNDLIYGGDGDDSLYGGNGDDTLYGDNVTGGGKDRIFGGVGADKVSGGYGADILTGGIDADIFIYSFFKSDSGVSVTSRDIIADFKRDESDKIDLQAMDANDDMSGNQTFRFISTAPFTQPGQVRFDPSAHMLYANTDTDKDSDFSIELTGVSSLQASDLIL